MNFTISDADRVPEPHIKVFGFGEFGKSVIEKLQKNIFETVSYTVFTNESQKAEDCPYEIVTSLSDYDLVIFLADMEEIREEIPNFLQLARMLEENIFSLAILTVTENNNLTEIIQVFDGHIPLTCKGENNNKVQELAYLATDGIIKNLLEPSFICLDIEDIRQSFSKGNFSLFATEIASGEDRADQVTRKLLQGIDFNAIPIVQSILVFIGGCDVTMEEYAEVGERIQTATMATGQNAPEIYIGIYDYIENKEDINLLRVSVYFMGYNKNFSTLFNCLVNRKY